MTKRLEPGEEIADILSPYRGDDRRVAGDHCWVLANMVSSLDGGASIAGRVGELSAPTDAQLFKLLRSVADVVVVGAETVRRERYGRIKLPDALQAERRDAGRAPVPPLAIVARSLELDWSSPLFDDAEDQPRTIVITCASADAERLEWARGRADVVVAGEQRVEPAAMLAALGERGARVVLCEGGPTLLGDLVAADLLDELCLTVAPVMGSDPLPVAVVSAPHTLVRFRLAHALVDDDTLFLRYTRPGGPMTSDPGELVGELVSGMDPAMVIVTTAVGDERAGCLVGFHSQCSMQPVRYAVWLSKVNYTYRLARRAEMVVVHFLDSSHGHLAELFGTLTGDEVDKFARCAWSPGPGGVPLLAGCPNHLVGRRVGMLDDTCDHVCVVLEPVEADGHGGFTPLRLADVADLDAGHDVEG